MTASPVDYSILWLNEIGFLLITYFAYSPQAIGIKGREKLRSMLQVVRWLVVTMRWILTCYINAAAANCIASHRIASHRIASHRSFAEESAHLAINHYIYL